jgi:glycosyltransferase involved in cell wall biosynthesis
MKRTSHQPIEFSVVMATYNGERFIREQLESLAAQALPPRELVVGDDGSTDRTLAIIDEFAARAPFPVRVQRNGRRLGPSENFLHAARRCAGEWIAFCDQDDVWLPQKLKRMAEIVDANPKIVLAAHRATIIDEHSNPGAELNEPPVDRLTVFPPLRHRLWRAPFGFTEIFRRFLIQDFPFEGRPPKVTHDRWIFWLANVTGHTAFLPDRLALYRRHQTNESQFNRGPNLRGQLADSAAHASFENASDYANEFAVYLSAQTLKLTGSVRKRVETGAWVYARLARHLRQRVMIWDPSRPLAARLASWTRLAASGGYKGSGGGWRSAGKDLVRLAWSLPGESKKSGTA